MKWAGTSKMIWEEDLIRQYPGGKKYSMKVEMIQRQDCPVCKSKKLKGFLQRENEPVHQNFIMMTKQSAREISRGTLTLACCTECGFIFNQTYEPTKMHYSQDYDNTQICSPQFNEYHNTLIKKLIENFDFRNRRIVEVGCGKGKFITKLIQESGLQNQGFGFDPSYNGPENVFEGKLNFQKDFYGRKYAHIRADTIICRHVIEHIPNPLNLLEDIKGALVQSSDAKVFFETPCVEWILKNNVIWDFFYEHCSYFNEDSLRTVFENSGYEVEKIEHLFGGQYLWLEGTLTTGKKSVMKRAGNISLLSSQFEKNYHMLQKKYLNYVQILRCEGNVGLWGAGAKGVTLANLIDPLCKNITAVIDINPQKQGHYIPGTGHPIIDYHQISDYRIKNLILMNPNYFNESKLLLQQSGIKANLVELN
jgi:SAM-dependent methyltransferase